MAKVERVFPLGYRAAEGHFPGNPIIPGAVLLSEVLTAIEAEIGIALQPCHIKAAKFLYPTRPGDRVQIEFADLGAGQVKFTCVVDGKTVLTGQTSTASP